MPRILNLILCLAVLALLTGACASADSIAPASAANPETTIQTVAPGALEKPVTPSPTTVAPANASTGAEGAAATAPASSAEASPTKPTEAKGPTSTAPAGEPAAAPPTPRPTLGPDEWKQLPVIPEISPGMLEVFRRGQELGNHPLAFSKVGDCGSTPAWFLGDFDRGPRYYRLGEHTDLEGVIGAFQGSYARTSLAAKAGFNASSVFTTLWSDRSQCAANETPLACEYRVHRPAVSLITLGTNDAYHLDTFEEQMRQIIEVTLENGIIPVVATKPDNLEGDESINATIARLAHEYDIPLWNYWRAVQELPNGALQEDGAHITWGANRFDDPQVMQKGWPVRNLTALQMLDAVWRQVIQPETE